MVENLEGASLFGGLPSAGYYGPKGANLVAEAICVSFGDVLMRVAQFDPLIRARSAVEFLQPVVVPEVVVDPIREDMRIDGENALDILEESDTSAAGVIQNRGLCI